VTGTDVRGRDLHARDLRAAWAFAERTLAVRDLATVETDLLGDLAELVGADAATLHRTDVRGPHQLSVGWPPGRLTVDLAESFGPVLHTHPFVPIYAGLRPGTLAGRPFRVSDVMSQRQWRATPVAREAMPDAADQLGAMLGARDRGVLNVVLTRVGGTFADRERDVLGLVLRHLAVAVSRARPRRAVALQSAPSAGWVPVAPAAGDGPVERLTPRELQVLRLVADGLTDAQVASRLRLSPRTVSKHLQRIYARLEVPNRAAAVTRLRRATAGSSPDLTRAGTCSGTR
jgi:DNA-binding CsgD family transcriptional regulator